MTRSFKQFKQICFVERKNTHLYKKLSSAILVTRVAIRPYLLSAKPTRTQFELENLFEAQIGPKSDPKVKFTK